MKRNIILKIVLFISPIIGYTQQQEQFSMYMENNFLVNPAEGGTEEFIDLKMGYRTQWVDFDNTTSGHPQNVYVSGHAPIGKHESKDPNVEQRAFHGLGGAVISDRIGVFNIINAKVGYAYHLPVSKKLILSLGAFGGIKQFGLDRGKVKLASDKGIDADPFANKIKTTLTPDVSLGVWGYADNYYFGLASFQLIESNIKLEDAASTSPGGLLKMHHWLTAGYKLNIDSAAHFFVVPSFVLKYVQSAPVTFDLNAKLRYEQKYWLGVSYRQKDAIVGMLGVTVKKVLDIAYAHDFTLSKVNEFSTATHEVILGLRIPNHQHKVPPAQFW